MLHSITGKSELERLCQSGRTGWSECQEIEYSLYHSKSNSIQQLLVAEKMKVKSALETVLRVKRIYPDDNQDFIQIFVKFLLKIISYNNLRTFANETRSISYDETNEEHEKMLYRLWGLIKADDSIDKRYSSRWGEIGFQGNNPATDFRGLGILSLQNMIYLFENWPEKGLKIYGQSQHPKFGFSFAITGINMTGIVYDLLRSGKMKGHLYNLPQDEYFIEDFHNFYVDIFYEFADYWVYREPQNIMSFGVIRDDFVNIIKGRLERGEVKAVA